MDFTLTDEQRQLQEQASDFATRKLAGIARELEDNNTPLPHKWMKRLAKTGGAIDIQKINIAATLAGRRLDRRRSRS